MTTHFRYTVVAAAAAALFAGGSAWAGGGDGPGRHHHHHHEHSGIIVKGLITVNAKAGAATSNVQTIGTSGPMLGTGSPQTITLPSQNMTATIGNNAAAGGSGNIGLNSAAGVQNAQANDTSIARIAAQNVFGTATVSNLQTVSGVSASGGFPFSGVTTNASLGDSALKGASGNLSVNIAAGSSNAQSNAMAITQSANPTLAMATATSVQQASGNSESGNFTNTASIGGNALMNASGNVGVNVASGVANLQHNGLSMIVAP